MGNTIGEKYFSVSKSFEKELESTVVKSPLFSIQDKNFWSTKQMTSKQAS